MDDTSHTQIKSELDKIVKNIDAILRKVEKLDPTPKDGTDSGDNATN